MAAIIIRSTRRVRVVLEQMLVWHFAGGGGFGRTTTTVLVVRGPFRRQSVTHFWASSCEAKSFLSESLCQSRFVGRCDDYYGESAINNNKNDKNDNKNEKLLFKHNK